MRIQCNACESAVATVLCCADEAALCSICDQEVHAANKLAGKHQRVRLIAGDGGGSSRRVPKCDICQESSGYFFCMEDRALLCQTCDVAVHTANEYVAAHKRFLLAGVQVGFEPSETVGLAAAEKSNVALNRRPLNAEPMLKTNPSLVKNSPVLHRTTPSLASNNSTFLPNQMIRDGGLVADKLPLSRYNFSNSTPDWPLDEMFEFTDCSQDIGLMDHGSSKADSGKLGSSEGSAFNNSANEERDTGECFEPNLTWMVPEVLSPPTFSGLHWQKHRQYRSSDNTAYVPDICSSQDPYRHVGTHSKRSRLS